MKAFFEGTGVKGPILRDILDLFLYFGVGLTRERLNGGAITDGVANVDFWNLTSISFKYCYRPVIVGMSVCTSAFLVRVKKDS